MSGYGTPARLLMNPPVSKWLVAPRPSLNSSQRAPIIARAKSPIDEYSVTGCVQATWK